VQTKRIATLVALLSWVLLSGCGKESTAANPKSDTQPPHRASTVGEEISKIQRKDTATRSTEDLWISIPTAFQFSKFARIESAPSWRARIARLGVTDQAYLAGVSERYLGSVEFHDEAEQRHLVEQGFPMPEEWLAARDMPDSELESLAGAGNIKAQMFLVDRVSERLAPIQASRQPGVSPAISETEIIREFARSTNMAGRLLGRTDSPFAAYLYGRAMSAGTWGGPPEPMAAALTLARDRGDTRAGMYLEAFSRTHSDMDAGYVLSLYSGMRDRERKPS